MLEHLTAEDKLLVLDKAAQYLALELARDARDKQLHRGVQAIATALGCSRATAAKLLADQRISYTRLGKKGYCCTQGQLQAYLQNT